MVKDYVGKLDVREAIGIDGDARGPDRFMVTDDGDRWTVEQILVDNQRVKGVRLASGEAIDAGMVVSSADCLSRKESSSSDSPKSSKYNN